MGLFWCTLYLRLRTGTDQNKNFKIFLAHHKSHKIKKENLEFANLKFELEKKKTCSLRILLRSIVSCSSV